MLGFVPPLDFVPLLIDGIDFVWVIGALGALIVVLAGWTIYGVVFQVFKDVSILGVKPFSFIANMLQSAMRSVAQPLMRLVGPFAHFIWALVMTVWRPLYVIVTTLQYLLGQITGANQAARQAEAQLQAKEQADMADANARMNRLHNEAIAAEQAQAAAINARMDNMFNQLTAEDAQGIAGVNTRIDGVFNQLTAQENADAATINARIGNVFNQLEATVANDVAGVNIRMDNVFNQLTAGIANGVQEAEGYATGLVGGLGLGAMRSTLTSLAGRLSKVETETAECLDPLCNTVTPNAARAGRNLNWAKNLEALAVEAAILALAAECMTNPGAVANDVSTVVNSVGGPVVHGIRDLIGA